MGSNVVVTRRNVFQRLGDSIKGIVVGLIIFLLAFPLLFWNEGRAVKTAKSLSEGAAAVISVPASPVDPGNDGRLIHVVAPVEVSETLRDDVFGIEATGATGLKRTVEMYQWREDSRTETRTSVGGTEERVTTYSYRTEWSSTLNDSSRFNNPEGHRNPAQMPFPDATFRASSATFGDFRLSDSILSRFSNFENLSLTTEQLAAVPESIRNTLTVQDGLLYRGANPTAPQVGDVRIRFERAPAVESSIIGAQSGLGFAQYQTSAGRALLFVRTGNHTAEAMFADAMAANVAMTWFLRFLGWLMLFGGLMALFKPLAVVASVLPIAGSIVRTGSGIVAFLIATPIALIVIAIAWIVFRPLLGILLLILGIGLAVGLKFVWKKAPPAEAQQQAEAVAAAGPPPEA
ncbi:MAG: hypothetical protein EA398_07200 [Deltaproteobacteria bacterium]|nr:MAG: hypothetical protein EA398_07200 [Deltaproteobacteria bacterium]